MGLFVAGIESNAAFELCEDGHLVADSDVRLVSAASEVVVCDCGVGADTP